MTEINEYTQRPTLSLIYEMSSDVHPFILPCSTISGGNHSMSATIVPPHSFDRMCDAPCRQALVYSAVVPTKNTWFHFVTLNNISVEVLWLHIC